MLIMSLIVNQIPLQQIKIYTLFYFLFTDIIHTTLKTTGKTNLLLVCTQSNVSSCRVNVVKAQSGSSSSGHYNDKKNNNNVTVYYATEVTMKTTVHWNRTPGMEWNVMRSEISFFKVRQVEKFEASSTLDSTGDVNHVIRCRKKHGNDSYWKKKRGFHRTLDQFTPLSVFILISLPHVTIFSLLYVNKPQWTHVLKTRV